MTYTVLIVEDEPAQLDVLTGMLAEYPNYRLLGSVSSVEAAQQFLAATTPDLVFLDVMLPPYTSFDLLNTLTGIPFEIIFTTSFEEFAVKAFRLSAVDYLVKPLARGQLAQALQKFEQRRISQASVAHIRTLLDNIRQDNGATRIALPTLKGYVFVPVKDIVRCASDNTYTTFFTTAKQSIVVSKTLKECEQMLVDHRFFRVHNSHLVNLEYITEYIKGEGGIVKMVDGSQIDVSRRRKEEFLHLLKRL